MCFSRQSLLNVFASNFGNSRRGPQADRYILALVVSEKVGKKRKIGEEWSFFLSFMLTPAVGLVISLMTKPKE